MSANTYLSKARKLIEEINTTQLQNIQAAAVKFSDSILAKRAVHVFGSGHSVIPVLDIFPQYNRPTHPSGKSLHDVVDILIDNCSPSEDALVEIEGLAGKVAASSTLTSVSIAMALVAETAAEMSRRGQPPERVFVSPNVSGIPKSNNDRVFTDYEEFEREL